MTTSPPTHHLPDVINADTMVIRSERGFWRHALDLVLTLLAWAAFIYLFARGLWTIVRTGHVGVDMPLLSQLHPTISDLGVYLLAVLFLGMLLLVWVRYNAWHFQGKQRRTNVSPIVSKTQPMLYGVELSALQKLRATPISVIHHREDGTLERWEASPTLAPDS